MQILKNEILLQLTFARQDIESIVPLDENLDQKISNSEFQNADKGLYALFSHGVDLRVDEKPVQIKRIDARATESDAINLTLNFPYQGHKKLSLAMPVIGRFARGHRQHLTVQNSKGELLKQSILNAGSDAVFIMNGYDSGNGTVILAGCPGLPCANPLISGASRPPPLSASVQTDGDRH